MRILHIIIGLETGGAELLLERLVGASAQEHEIISLTDMGPVGARLVVGGCPVHAMGMKHIWDLPATIWKLSRIIKRKQPDVVHTWMYHADLIGGLAARLAGLPRTIWSIHAVDINLPGTRSAQTILPLCAKLSKYVPDQIVCVSKEAAAFHASRGYDAQKMKIISNGIDIDKLDAQKKDPAQARDILNLPKDKIIVGCVARFNETKDIKTLIEAADVVLKQNQDTDFMLVGAGLDANNQELMTWISATERKTHFHLLGERSDIGTCLSAMDIFCLSSITESFGLAVGEAMAMDKPCVTTDVDALPDLVGGCGITVPAQDPFVLGNALLSLINAESTYREDLGQKGRKRIEKHFSLAHMVGEYDGLYEELIKSPSP